MHSKQSPARPGKFSGCCWTEGLLLGQQLVGSEGLPPARRGTGVAAALFFHSEHMFLHNKGGEKLWWNVKVPLETKVLPDSPNTCLWFWSSLLLSNGWWNVVFAKELQQKSSEAKPVSSTSVCVRCPWYDIDAQDDVTASVLLVARHLIRGLSSQHYSAGGAKNSSRILHWWDTHGADQSDGLVSRSCKVKPQLSHIPTWLLTWWTALFIMPVARGSLLGAAMQQSVCHV